MEKIIRLHCREREKYVRSTNLDQEFTCRRTTKILGN